MASSAERRRVQGPVRRERDAAVPETKGGRPAPVGDRTREDEVRLSAGRATLTPTMDRKRDAGGLELISKAGAVLEVLESSGPTSASDLAVKLGEPLSSVYRLMQSLTSVGWVDRVGKRGPYRLGLSWMTVGGLLEDHLDIREACRPALRSLLESTGATSFLCVRRGSRAVCLERFEGRSVQSLAMQLGGSLPLYSGAAPRALLAFLSHAEQVDALAEDVVFRGDPVRPDPVSIEADLAQIRAQGYAVSDGDVTPGVGGLGAPVFNHRGEVEGALSISGLAEQVLGPHVVAENITLLRQAATQSSSALGWEPQ
jgi:DNA-binding IclR family transcriptional regulator